MSSRSPAKSDARFGPIKEIAAELGLKYSTLRDLALTGEIAALRLGKPGSRRQAMYLERAEVSRYCDSHLERRLA